MSYLRVGLVLSLLAAALVACCCCLNVLGGNVEFTTGDFSDVPVYPGASQTTETNSMIGTVTGIFALLARDAEWKHYTTSDPEADVLEWYSDTLPNYGWTDASGQYGTSSSEGSLAFVSEDDPSLLLVIFAGPLSDGGVTDIIIGRMHIR